MAQNMSQQSKLWLLMDAISRGDVEAALLLVEQGADVGEPYGVWTALHFAAEKGLQRELERQEELVRALLEAGASVDAIKGQSAANTGGTPLQVAAGCGFTRPDVLKLLLKYKEKLELI